MTNGIIALDKAISTLRALALPAPQFDLQTPVLALLSQTSDLDENRSVLIAKALQSSEHFNAIIRENIKASDNENRFIAITDAFDSIVSDLNMSMTHLADGKIDMKEKMQGMWMRIRRGDIPLRFNKIRDLYLGAAKDARSELDREKTVLDAYMDFRVALKEAEIAGKGLHKLAEAEVEQKRSDLVSASESVSGFTGTDAEEKGRLELVRDQAQRSLTKSEQRFGVVKKISENLTIAYNTGEVVMARLQQTTDVKEQVLQQMILFFATNESVFTGLHAAMTSMTGLAEKTKVLDAAQRGAEKALETLAGVGNDILNEGLKAAHGPSIRAEYVQKLVSSVVEFQAGQRDLIRDQQKLATENARLIEESVEEGKRRFAEITTEASAFRSN